MVTANPYGHLGKHLLSGLNYVPDTIKVALLSSAHTPNLDTHEFFSDVSANQVTGTGYTAGGQALSRKSLGAYDATNNRTPALAANTVWNATGGSLTGRYAVVYKDTGTPGTSPLVSLVDFEADVSATNDTFTIDWNDVGGVVSV